MLSITKKINDGPTGLETSRQVGRFSWSVGFGAMGAEIGAGIGALFGGVGAVHGALIGGFIGSWIEEKLVKILAIEVIML